MPLLVLPAFKNLFPSIIDFSFTDYMWLNPLHDDFENFVELICGEALDVLGTGIEVASDVGEYGEVGIDRGGIAFEDFKVCVAGRQTEPNTLIIGDGVVENGLNS